MYPAALQVAQYAWLTHSIDKKFGELRYELRRDLGGTNNRIEEMKTGVEEMSRDVGSLETRMTELELAICQLRQSRSRTDDISN